MFRKIYYLLFIGIFFVSCKTQKALVDTKAVEEVKTEDANKRLANSLLWEITGEGIEKPSYLFGTIHIIDSDKYFLPKGSLQAFENSDEVVFEIDLNDMQDMSKLFSLMMDANMNDGVTLADLLNDQDYKLVKNHFEEMGVPFMLMEKIKPMFLSMMGGGDIDPMSLESGEMLSYEMELFEMANSTGKKVAGLETMEYQMSLFDSIPYKSQAEMLVESIKNGGEEENQFAELIGYYQNQDIESLSTLISSESDDGGNFEELLVVKRNKNWIAPILQKSKLAPTFFAVGAGHLGGEMGVIRLLREEGYSVKAIIKE